MDEKYRLCYADPPWEFATRSPKGKGRSQEAYYDTLPVSVLVTLPVQEMMADDSVLFLWVPKPMLPRAFEVIEAWGFTYKTNGFVWVKLTKNSDGSDLSHAKLHFGLGFWTRANPEQCLLATCGNPKRIGRDVPELIVSPVREHSRKPDETYDRIASDKPLGCSGEGPDEMLDPAPGCQIRPRSNRLDKRFGSAVRGLGRSVFNNSQDLSTSLAAAPSSRGAKPQ
jgi:N6-adenosine-specific RNA methylase IME4